MQRQQIIKLESHLQLLLKSYENLQKRVTELKDEVKQKDELLASNRSMINDLKEQLDNINTNTATPKDTQLELDEIQRRVLSLVNDVDNCIKAIE